MTITKEKIIADILASGELPRKEVRLAVAKLLGIIKQTLAQKEDGLVSGFGKFQVRRKKARHGRHPQTKEELELRPRRVVTFHTSGVFRRLINSEPGSGSVSDNF